MKKGRIKKIALSSYSLVIAGAIFYISYYFLVWGLLVQQQLFRRSASYRLVFILVIGYNTIDLQVKDVRMIKIYTHAIQNHHLIKLCAYISLSSRDLVGR